MIQSIFAVLNSIFPALGALTGMPLYVFLAVLALTGAFLIGYIVQGLRVGTQLRFAVKGVRALAASKERVRQEDVARILIKKPFRHLWKEYAESLHEVKMTSDGTGVKQPKAIEADYNMDGGVLKIKTRAALAGYVLRRWSIDVSPDHRLDPASHHLWLRNTPTLYGVESATLAPGAEPSGSLA